MHEALGAGTLWAMEAGALVDLAERAAISAILPPALAAAFAGQPSARTGGTVSVRAGGVAVMPLNGPLSPRGSYGGTSTERFADDMVKAAGDPTLRAIVVPIDSPGGMVFGLAEAADAVYATRERKPVLAVATPRSFSAAHCIACQASAYYASTSAQVGEVGVRLAHVDMSSFEAKIGMRTTLIASAPEKIAANPYAPLSDDDRATLEREAADMSATLRQMIARGRGMDAKRVDEVHGRGGRLSAQGAARRGTVDAVMTLREVIMLAINSPAELALIHRRAAVRVAIGLT